MKAAMHSHLYNFNTMIDMVGCAIFYNILVYGYVRMVQKHFILQGLFAGNLLAVTDLGDLICLFVSPLHDLHTANSFTHGSSRSTPHNCSLFFECFHCITEQVSHLTATTHLQ
jgi:hypothetical protein